MADYTSHIELSIELDNKNDEQALKHLLSSLPLEAEWCRLYLTQELIDQSLSRFSLLTTPQFNLLTNTIEIRINLQMCFLFPT